MKISVIVTLTLATLTNLQAQELPVLPVVTVTAERLTETGPTIASWDADDIASFAPRTIDELLATEPSFSLYRRQSSVFGNPTSAGVSLRRTGATAAARSLVTLDGIPQNDPFGGWVNWARFRPASLASARIVPAAQAAVWGNASPAGTVQLTSDKPSSNRTRLDLTSGTHNTWGAAASTDAISTNGNLAGQVSAFTLESDGFHGLTRSQRGPIDRPLDLTYHGATTRFIWHAADGLTIEPTLAYYEEQRGNGTPLARNATDALDLSLRLTKETDNATVQALGYYQQRDFQARFTAVDPTRTTERLALDQFDVPGQGLGGGLTVSLSPTESLDLMLGTDLRHLRGETNELAGAFRQRRAGGEQLLAGTFARATVHAGSNTAIDATARLDYWDLSDGERIETSPATNALLRSDTIADRDGFEPSFSLAANHQLTPTVTLDASAGTGFRLPTINELYRPFRVRSDITEANPELDPEHFISLSAGATWQPSDEFSAGLELFYHDIDDAIANVPVTDPARAATIAGFVPPGGSLAQRKNVDSARSWGIETRTRWQPDPLAAFTLTYLFSQTEFTGSPSQPLLENNAFPQSPEHRLVAGLESRPTDALLLFTQLEFGSRQYDDALSIRPLDPYTTVRLGAEFHLSKNLTLQARIENLFDEKVQTGLSTNNLISTGQPRSAWLNLRYTF
ncbi:MAG: TonB-dependent receptor [Verrucomicrobiales bacterium]|nr:TonB-dependent receptor [Verrucomicrobiales bacterium]